jgi:hypothetical protein
VTRSASLMLLVMEAKTGAMEAKTVAKSTTVSMVSRLGGGQGGQDCD